MGLTTVTNTLAKQLQSLTFEAPVSFTYNPLVYARGPFDDYLNRYGQGKKKIVLVGMNPGPWGMAQTGIPFGEVQHVRDWMNIEGSVKVPANVHPKRPVLGFACQRSEVSGRRLWSWAQERYQRPEAFFKHFFVLNYCPLAFFDEAARNVTPDKLKKEDREKLFAPCDKALTDMLTIMKPAFVLGVGNFAAQRVQAACQSLKVTTGRITHPSPANPKANRGWAPLIEQELEQQGVVSPR